MNYFFRNLKSIFKKSGSRGIPVKNELCLGFLFVSCTYSAKIREYEES